MCEVMERLDSDLPYKFFHSVGKNRSAVEAILLGTTLDEQVLKKLEGEISWRHHLSHVSTDSS